VVTEDGFDRYVEHRKDLNYENQKELIAQEMKDYALFVLCYHLSNNDIFDLPMNPDSNSSVDSYNNAYKKILKGRTNYGQRYKYIKTMSFTDIRAKGGHKVCPERFFFISANCQFRAQEDIGITFSLEPFDLPVTLGEEAFLEIKRQLPANTPAIDIDTLRNRQDNLFNAIRLGDSFEDLEKLENTPNPFDDSF
jgi:hypothetical protein